MGLWTDKDSAWREGQYSRGDEISKRKNERTTELNRMVEQMRGENQFRTASLTADVQREELAAKKPWLEAQTSSINTETGINKAKGEFELKEAPGQLKLNQEGLRLDSATKRGALMGQMEKFFTDSGVKSDSMAGFMNELYGEDYLKYSQGKEKSLVNPTVAPGTSVAKPSAAALTPSTEKGPKRTGIMKWIREGSRFALPSMGAFTTNALLTAPDIASGGLSLPLTLPARVAATVAGGAGGALLDSAIWGEKKTVGQAAMTAAEGSVAGVGGGAYKPGAVKSALKGVGEFFTGGATKKVARAATETDPRWFMKNKDVLESMGKEGTLPSRWSTRTKDILKRKAKNPEPFKDTRTYR